MKIKQHNLYFLMIILIISLLAVPVSTYGEPAADNISVHLRVEGITENIFTGIVTADAAANPTALDMLSIALTEAGIDYEVQDFGWGKMITAINGETNGTFGGWDSWLFMVNNQMAPAGADTYNVSNGENIVFFYGEFPPATLIPTVEISPSVLFVGQSFTATVTSTYFDWTNNEMVTVPVEGAVVNIDGRDYLTNADGVAVVTGISQPADYILKVSKERPDSFPALVRTGNSVVVKLNPLHDVAGMLQNTIDYYRRDVDKLTSWWEMLALNGVGVDITDGTWELPEWDSQKLDDASAATDYAGVILGLIARGENPTDIWGRNIVGELAEMQKEENGSFSGALNNTVWAMIALDAAYAAYDRESALQYILDAQKEDGGYAFFGDKSDPDATAMVMWLFSAYRDRAGVNDAIEAALNYLEQAQLQTAGFSSWDNENANSTAVVISALAALEESIYDERWMKNGQTMLDALMQFRLTSGAFSYLKEPLTANALATKDALIALGDLVAGNSLFYRYGFTRGDVNNDGNINVGDAIEILRHIVRLAPLNFYSQLAADLNNNGNIAVTDAIHLLRYIVGIIQEL